MPKGVDNMSATWVQWWVKNVFIVVDTIDIPTYSATRPWNTVSFTQQTLMLFTVVFHKIAPLFAPVAGVVIPRIHRAYNNQLKENLKNTSNRRSFV